MGKIAAYTPFARYALIILATKLVSGGWLPPEIAREIAYDPALVELLAGLMVYIGTGVWYYVSTAKRALDEAIG